MIQSICLLFIVLMCQIDSSLLFQGKYYIRDSYLYKYDISAIQNRPVKNKIHPIIHSRRSLREMNGQPLSDSVLQSLFEAARWAPSYFNTQSWRFVYAKRNGPYWQKYLDALNPGNQKWAKDAAVLMVVLSNKYQVRKGEKQFVDTHSFDTGAAWMAMALEGTARGLVVHAMTGFDKQKILRMINLPSEDEYTIEAMVAVGHRPILPNEEKTSQRYDIDKVVSEGIFKEKVYQ